MFGMAHNEARKTFDEQFIRSQRHIFRYIAALLPNINDAEEVFQDTCITILEKWETFETDRPMVPWACGIAQNMVRRFFERNRRHAVRLDEMTIAAVSETQHRFAAEIDDRLEKLPECVQKLPAEQQSLLDQCYTQGNTIRSIAKARHLDPDTLYKRLERIRRNLLECIERALTRG
jgi:RNA polymerase sigma-70 factor (ECF subfamily)